MARRRPSAQAAGLGSRKTALPCGGTFTVAPVARRAGQSASRRGALGAAWQRRLPRLGRRSDRSRALTADRLCRWSCLPRVK